MVDVDAPFAGTFHPGRQPLAVAFINSNTHAIRGLLAVGARSLVEPLTAGGAPQEALDLARARGLDSLAAQITDILMSRKMTEAGLDHALSAGDSAPRRTAV